MNHTLVNVKYLNLNWKEGDKGPKWFQLQKDLGTRIIPFGLQLFHFDYEDTKKKKIVFCTEGEIDMLTWIEAGYENIISVPQGAPSTKAKDFKTEFAYMHDPYVKSALQDVDMFVLSTDNDEAGKLLRYHLSLILGKDKCRLIKYPIGYKDINEVFAGSKKKNLPALGKKGVDDCFNNLGSIPIKGVIKASQVQDELRQYRDNGFLPGLGCGVVEIDKLFTVKPKLVTFITGTPGAGKSVFARWWITEMIRFNADLNLKWAMFTPENRPVSREYAKIAECLTGQYMKKEHRYAMNDEMYRNAMNFIEKHFFIISPDRSNYESWGEAVNPDKIKINTMQNILEYLKYLKKTENIFGYVIDAWNKIEHEQPKYMTETTFISQQLDQLISFNEYWDLHGIVIVHPKKIEQVGNNYKMPSLYDIKGSSAWKEKADIGIIVHRYKMKKKDADEITNDMDEDDKWVTVPDAPTIVRTEKIRFEETGVEDRVRLVMKRGGRFEVDNRKKPVKEEEDQEVMNLFSNPNGDTEDSELPF
jgi:twinkle protein